MPGDPQFVQSEEFRRSFDSQPFLFRHGLAGHELFTLPALLRLAREAGKSDTRKSSKGLLRQKTAPGFLVMEGRGSLRWGSPEYHQVIDSAFEHFDESNIRLKISSVHAYDGYRELLADCTRELSEQTGVDFSKQYGPGIATFFIASPNQTTPYHIDSEVNFLLQIRGLKHVHIFDGNDPGIVSAKNLEEFWIGHSFLKPVPGSSRRTFDLEPGQGVFNPPFFPHLVETAAMPCVSLSLGYERRRFPEAEVHRMNAYLRKIGWNPAPPGNSPTADVLKSHFIRRSVSLKRAILGD